MEYLMSRIYVVTDTTTGWKTLVEADNQHQATTAVIAGRYVAKAATSTEVADLMANDTVFIRQNKKADQPDLPAMDTAVASIAAAADTAPAGVASTAVATPA
jgi:hypothetical protein